MSVPTTYLHNVSEATAKVRQVLDDLMEAVLLVGVVQPKHREVWNSDVPDGVPEKFDAAVGWSVLDTLLGQVHAFGSIFHDDINATAMPNWSGEPPAWYLDILREDYEHKLCRTTSPVWLNSEEVHDEARRAASALKHYGVDISTT